MNSDYCLLVTFIGSKAEERVMVACRWRERQAASVERGAQRAVLAPAGSGDRVAESECIDLEDT